MTFLPPSRDGHRLGQYDRLGQLQQQVEPVAGVDDRGRPRRELVDLCEVARFRSLTRLVRLWVEIRRQVLDGGNIGLCRLLVHRLARRVDRVIEIALAVVCRDERSRLVGRLRGDRIGRPVGDDRGQ